MNIPSPLPKRKPRIEIVPLIDIIFFLLATFVMLSLSMIKNHGVTVDLPASSSGIPQERQESVSISIREDGQYFFNQDTVTADELQEQLKVLKQNNPETRIFINADAKAEFEYVVHVLDQVRVLGLKKVVIETKPRP